MRPMIINDHIREQAAKVVKYAKEHPFSIADLISVTLGTSKPAGDSPEFVFKIPIGYRVVYSEEDQLIGKVKHISISVDTPGKFPSPPAVMEIMRLVGMTPDLTKCRVEIGGKGGDAEAINVWEISKSSKL